MSDNNIVKSGPKVKSRVLNVPTMGGHARHYREWRRAGGTLVHESLRQQGEPPYAAGLEKRLVDKYWPGCLRTSTGDEFPDDAYETQSQRAFLDWIGAKAAGRLQDLGQIDDDLSPEAIGRTIGSIFQKVIGEVEERRQENAMMYEPQQPEDDVDPQNALAGASAGSSDGPSPTAPLGVSDVE